MSAAPDIWWPSVVLAAVLASDAVLSVRPPAFIRNCLNGVKFPQDWWWILVVIKALGAVGLVVGLKHGGIGFAANVAVICYFLCASFAHYRARFLRQEFWLNCLGMLGFALVVLVVSYT